MEHRRSWNTSFSRFQVRSAAACRAADIPALARKMVCTVAHTHHLSHAASFTRNFVTHIQLHTYIRTLRHTYTYLHTYIPTYLHTYNHTTWQAWHKLTSTIVSLAGAALMALGGALGSGLGARDAAPFCVAGVAQPYIHLNVAAVAQTTSTIVSRGRRGTHGTGWRAWVWFGRA